MALPINGGPTCRPGCGRCLSDISSPTGCSMTCQTVQCEPVDRPCRGCANPCEGGIFCGGVCTDLSGDPSNCGNCGHACPSGMVCSNGVCVCAPGLTNCNGICTNTSTDSANCGACGNSCGSDPCLGGQCPPSCPGKPQPFPWCGAPDSPVSCSCPLGRLASRDATEPAVVGRFGPSAVATRFVPSIRTASSIGEPKLSGRARSCVPLSFT